MTLGPLIKKKIFALASSTRTHSLEEALEIPLFWGVMFDVTGFFRSLMRGKIKDNPSIFTFTQLYNLLLDRSGIRDTIISRPELKETKRQKNKIDMVVVIVADSLRRNPLKHITDLNRADSAAKKRQKESEEAEEPEEKVEPYPKGSKFVIDRKTGKGLLLTPDGTFHEHVSVRRLYCTEIRLRASLFGAIAEMHMGYNPLSEADKALLWSRGVYVCWDLGGDAETLVTGFDGSCALGVCPKPVAATDGKAAATATPALVEPILVHFPEQVNGSLYPRHQVVVPKGVWQDWYEEADHRVVRWASYLCKMAPVVAACATPAVAVVGNDGDYILMLMQVATELSRKTLQTATAEKGSGHWKQTHKFETFTTNLETYNTSFAATETQLYYYNGVSAPESPKKTDEKKRGGMPFEVVHINALVDYMGRRGLLPVHWMIISCFGANDYIPAKLNKGLVHDEKTSKIPTKDKFFPLIGEDKIADYIIVLATTKREKETALNPIKEVQDALAVIVQACLTPTTEKEAEAVRAAAVVKLIRYIWRNKFGDPTPSSRDSDAKKARVGKLAVAVQDSPILLEALLGSVSVWISAARVCDI